MRTRLVLLAALLATTTGCTTIKGWFADDKAKALAPAPLVEIAEPVAVRELWSRNLGDGNARRGLRQAPAVEGARLFVSNDAGEVLALGLASGDVLWDSNIVRTGKLGSRWTFWKRRIADGGLSGGPGVGNGLVVAGGRNGEVVALDAETGAERWRARVTSEVIAPPLVSGDRVVVRSNDGRTFGLDVADGARKWVFDRGLPSLSTRGTGAPVTDGELVYLGYDDGNVIALRMQDGNVVWIQRVAEPEGRNELDRMSDVDGEMQLGLGELYATSVAGQTLAVASANGRPLWSRDVGGYGGLVLLGDRLVLADPQGIVWALDRNNGSALWKQEGLARRWLSSPALQGDYVVFGDVEGYLHWIRTSDGQLAGRERVDRAPIRGTPQVAPTGELVVLSADGRLTAFAAP